MAIFLKIFGTVLSAVSIALGVWFMYAALSVLADKKISESSDDASYGIVVGGGAFASALLIAIGLAGMLGIWA